MERTVHEDKSSEVVFPDLYRAELDQPSEIESENSSVDVMVDLRAQRFGKEITKQNLMLQLS